MFADVFINREVKCELERYPEENFLMGDLLSPGGQYDAK
jgi:hypothetical protein